MSDGPFVHKCRFKLKIDASTGEYLRFTLRQSPSIILIDGLNKSHNEDNDGQLLWTWGALPPARPPVRFVFYKQPSGLRSWSQLTCAGHSLWIIDHLVFRHIQALLVPLIVIRVRGSSSRALGQHPFDCYLNVLRSLTRSFDCGVHKSYPNVSAIKNLYLDTQLTVSLRKWRNARLFMFTKISTNISELKP